MAKSPNILWICTDQQRMDTLGCYGNQYVKTPNLDKLASSGVMFNHAYCQNPVCAPSRASFITGRYPSTTKCRQNGQMISKDEIPVTRILRDAGYNCGLAGKLHIAPCNPSVCNVMEERIDDGYAVFNWSHGSPAKHVNNDYHVWLRSEGQEFTSQPFENSNQVEIGMPEKYHQSTWCTNKAIDFISANAAQDKPWLFSYHCFDPHHPFDPPIEYLERYLTKLDELPLPNYKKGEQETKGQFQQNDYENGAYNHMKKLRSKDMSEKDHRLVKAAYYAMVDLVDRQLGRLFDSLESLGQLDNTIIIFHSDHGELLGDHGMYLKGPHLYDCSVRVPLIISWPNKIKATVTDTMVELVDIAPTILEAVGLPKEPGMQGKSLWSLLTGETDTHRQDAMCECYNSMVHHKNPSPYVTMLRTHDYKLIAHHGQNFGELYDMKNDPGETTNLWDNPQYTSERFILMQRLCDRLAFNCDPLPIRAAGY